MRFFCGSAVTLNIIVFSNSSFFFSGDVADSEK